MRDGPGEVQDTRRWQQSLPAVPAVPAAEEGSEVSQMRVDASDVSL